MRYLFSLLRRQRNALIAAGIACAVGAGWLAYAQVGGERGIAPVASSNDIEVMDVEVDVTAASGIEAREKAWAEAQAKAWKKIGGPDLSDSQIAGMVSAIIIQRERLGPRRYIATLGVVFDRARAARHLGAGGRAQRSAPMLLLPVTISGGTAMIYEQRNPWQRAWAEFQAGASRINYVRPSGVGGDSLMLTYGQTNRRSRVWWRDILDGFGADDVLIPVAELHYMFPGGPVEGRFTARYGPDGTFLKSFTLRADNSSAVPEMLAQAVRRFDQIYTDALTQGMLKPDSTLNIGIGALDPRIARLVDLGRRLKAQDASAAERETVPVEENDGTITSTPIESPPPEGSVALYTVQVSTPDAPAYDEAMAGIRGAIGVRAIGVRSTTIGGTSVLTISYAGSIGDLAQALRKRGFTVRQGNNALIISR